MAKKNRSKKRQDPGGSSDFKANPFVGLHIPVVDKGENKVKTEPKTEVEKIKISQADKELLVAMGGDSETEFSNASEKLSFNIERKGRGGKTVTLVYGLKYLGMEERMILVQKLKKSLGTSARFEENVLQIQGDIIERAKKFLHKLGFNVG